MNREQRNKEIRHIIEEINSPKHRLLDALRKLESIPGTKTKSEALSSIIVRLEDWQHRR